MHDAPLRTVEIGHTYAPDRLLQISTPGSFPPSFEDNPRAWLLRQLAAEFGHGTLVVALLDDVEVRQKQKKSQDSWRWQMFISTSEESLRQGTGADLVRLESRLEQPARELISEVRQMDLSESWRFSRDKRTLIIGSGKSKRRIPLEGFAGVDDKTYPSCQMLDLAWLRERLTLAPEAITVLPERYREQQQDVETLTSLFPDMAGKFKTIYTE